MKIKCALPKIKPVCKIAENIQAALQICTDVCMGICLHFCVKMRYNVKQIMRIGCV